VASPEELMKLICTVFLCVSGFLSVSGQTGKSGYSDPRKDPKPATLTLAREDADGNITENIDVFRPTDIPIYCYVDLNSTAPVTVKLNFIAVKVKGVRPNARVISISYATKNGEDNVTFTGKPEKVWIVGVYRVDILLDGKPTLSKSFEVQLSN
jgi:hypothetical protein